jgi:hypothetical protein
MIRFATGMQFALLAACAIPAFSQAVVEGALLGTASSAAATGAKGAGAASGGVFGALQKTLDGANQTPKAVAAAPVATTTQAAASVANPGPASAKSQVTVPPAARSTPKPAVPKDLASIAEGLTREELVEKYGQPAFKTTQVKGEQTVEVYTYMQARETVDVTLLDGVVAAKLKPAAQINPTSRAKPITAAARVR